MCAFSLTYGRSTITAELSQDTITLANDAVSAYRFGCIQKVTGSSMPEQGLLGLGRGPMSLLSQTQLLYGSTFSYCLPSLKSPNFSGSLRLGPFGQPKWTKYTPLLNNPRRPSLYYVNLIGVRVGHRYVDIPPGSLDFNPSTGAGTIFDSGNFFYSLSLIKTFVHTPSGKHYKKVHFHEFIYDIKHHTSLSYFQQMYKRYNKENYVIPNPNLFEKL